MARPAEPSGNASPSASASASPSASASASPSASASASPSASASASPSASDSLPPTDRDAVLVYLRAKRYEALPARESAQHPSKGPHSRRGDPVRVFLSADLDASLAANATAHPAGSAAVKELWTRDGQLRGWAVMVKTAADGGDDGEGWWWYEIVGDRVVTAGHGIDLCASCHSAGDDFILTAHPLQ